jgi:2-polyprenyl-3-methyl-5-hydroxy-6-metoxy-1,4-benzoquinol methylase
MSNQTQLFSNCPICLNNLISTDIVLKEGSLLKCFNCNHLLSSCNVEQYNDALDKWDTTNGTLPNAKSQNRHRKNTLKRLQLASSFLPNQSKITLLDVGCSSGSVLAVAKDLGFDVKGVDTALQAVNTARSFGFDVFHGTLDEAKYDDNEFDLIVLFELIEHITNPKQLLQECHRILKKNGVVLINTPNASSWTASFMREKWGGFSLRDMGGHISFFSAQSITKLAKQTGFNNVLTQTRNVSFYYKEDTNKIKYKLFKLLSELLAYPARFFNKGHDLFVLLQK